MRLNASMTVATKSCTQRIWQWCTNSAEGTLVTLSSSSLLLWSLHALQNPSKSLTTKSTSVSSFKILVQKNSGNSSDSPRVMYSFCVTSWPFLPSWRVWQGTSGRALKGCVLCWDVLHIQTICVTSFLCLGGHLPTCQLSSTKRCSSSTHTISIVFPQSCNPG